MTATARHAAGPGTGFAAPGPDAAVAFRALLDAMSRPGRVVTLAGASAPAGLSPAAAVVLLTLADPATPVHLAGGADTGAARGWLAFHTGAPLAPAEGAAIAAGDWHALLPWDRFALGDPSYPDRSATLIAEVPRLEPAGARLTGPGIAGEARLSLPATAPFRANRALFPLGLDLILTCGDRLAAIPRSTFVEDA
jgi:alpha-D-ribose 1-methylphosphonate 5-triphosphate synthase subunit PhnH